jgi:hypothetical protein
MKGNTRLSRMKEARVERLRASMKEASKKRHMNHHDAAVLRKSRAVFCEDKDVFLKIKITPNNLLCVAWSFLEPKNHW